MSDLFNITDPNMATISKAHTDQLELQTAIGNMQALAGLTEPDGTPKAPDESQKKAGDTTPPLPGSFMVDYKNLAFSSTPKQPPDPNSWLNWGIKSVAEIGLSPVTGLVSALNQTGKNLDELNDGIHDYLASKGLPKVADWVAPPINYNDTTDLKPDPNVSMFTHIPNLEPETVPGGLSHGMTQFLWGLLGTQKIFKAWNLMQEAPAVYRGIATSSLTAAHIFDGHDGNIANIIKEYPALQGPYTDWMAEYLATGNEDNQFSGRLKNVITGNLQGALGHILFKGLAIAGAQMRAIKTAADATDAKQAQYKSNLEQIANNSATSSKVNQFGNPDTPVLKTFDNISDAEAGKQVAPGPGHTYDPDTVSKWSADHAPEGQEAPQLLQPIDYPKEFNRVATKYGDESGAVSRVAFETNEDRLAYIATSSSSKAAQALQVLKSAGWTDEQVTDIGGKLRDYFKSRAPGAGDTTITAPKLARQVYSQGLGDFAGVPTDYIGGTISRIPVTNSSGVEINWGAARDPEGITNLVDQLTEAFEKKPTLRTWAQERANANYNKIVDEALGDGPASDVLNASQTEALRLVRAASLTKLKELSDEVRTTRDLPGGTPDDTSFRFALQLNTHRMLSNYWRSVGTEGARAQNIRKAASGEDMGKGMAALDRYLDAVKDTGNISDLADIVSNLDNGTPAAAKAFSELLRNGDWMKTSGKYLRATYVNNLLSAPASLQWNFMAPFTVTAQQMLERGMGIVTNRLLGDASGMDFKSLMHYTAGYVGAFREGVQYFPDAFRYGGKGRAWGEQYARGALDELSRPNALNDVMSDNLNPGGNGFINKGIDTLGYANTWATRTNISCDEFHTTTNYRGELQRLIYDQVKSEVDSGGLPREEYNTRFAELLNKPTKELKQQAVDNAYVSTFTQDNSGRFAKIASAIQDFGKGYPLGGWLLVPFKHVPSNILEYSFDHSPLLAFKQAELRQAISRGGTEAQEALGKIGGAVFMTSLGLDLYQRGMLIGKGSYQPGQEQLQGRENILPYSLKIGDNKYVKYNRLDAQGMLFGLIGDMGDYYSYLHDQDHNRMIDGENATIAFITAIAGSSLNKSYFKSVNDAMKATTNPLAYGQNLVSGIASSLLVPNAGLLRSIARGTGDDTMHEVRHIWDTIQANIPGLAEGQPDAFDLWGRNKTISRGSSQAFNAFTPIEMSVSNPDPVDRAMTKYGIYLQMPDKQFTMGNYTVSTKDNNFAYSRYVQLAGNGLIDPVYKMGAKDLLNAITSGAHPLSKMWDALPETSGPGSPRYSFMRDIVTHYRKEAQMQLLQEYPALTHFEKRPMP